VSTPTTLQQRFDRSVAAWPDRSAVEEPGGIRVSYRDLGILSDRLRERLTALGVRPGDRVGLCLRKSIDAVATLYGALKCGAAYVPTDPLAPASRNAYILNDCAVTVAVIHRRFEAALRQEFEALGRVPRLIVVDDTEGARPGLADALDREGIAPSVASNTHPGTLDDLAYILYTSGSTGKPKGVIISQRNALGFVDWCSETFEPTANDRFSSHAPLHFDLSILDIHVPFQHGAAIVLVAEDIGKDAARLAPLIAHERITIWYSAPSILTLLAQYGKLDTQDYSALRTVLFAGEVFPVTHLRTLMNLLPAPRYYNLYGPTETNVCTFYEVVGPVPPDRTDPYPIGKVCSHLRGRVVDESGTDVRRGDEGELCIAGSAVTQGYWNLAEQTARAFLADTTNGPWYKTGDVVVEQADGDYVYRGRRDRMIKKRGYRVELGEIESCLYGFPGIKEVGVVAIPVPDGLQVKAFVSTRDQKKPSIIALKKFCADRLPLYMVPDVFVVQTNLPRTSTDKVDYQQLKAL
jgi:amino acid adenylation domain-containing protein